MSDYNSTHNRAVWFDIPVAELDRAIAFYRAILGVGVEKHEFAGSSIGVIEKERGAWSVEHRAWSIERGA